MHTFPEHVLARGPWSASKMGTIEQCSLKFDLKYTHHTPEERVSAESRVGVAVHAALEMALRGSPIHNAMRYGKEQFELTSAEEEELDARVEQIERFTSRMDSFRKKYGVVQEMLEERWGMGADFSWSGYYGDRTGVPVFFRGAVDFAMYTRTKDLIIIDHKSGKQKDLEYYQTQLRVYSLMGMAKFPEARGVQCAINFVMPDKLEWCKYTTAAQVRDEYRPWLVEHMTKVCAGLLVEPTPTKTKLCDWCGYKPLCPAHREVTGGQPTGT